MAAWPTVVSHPAQSGGVLEMIQRNLIEGHLLSRSFYFEFFVRTYSFLAPFVLVSLLRISQVPRFLIALTPVLLVVFGQFVVAAGTGRLWFYSFPVVIPLAVSGVKLLIDGTERKVPR